MTADGISVRLKNDLAELDRLAHAVAEFAEAHRLNADVLFALNLSLEEIVTNVVCYGYGDDREHWIDVRLADLRVRDAKDPSIDVQHDHPVLVTL